MQQVLVGSEEAEGLKVGEQLIKEVKIEDLTRSKIQQIKQLMIQKLREAEKEKIYEGFKEHESKNITAVVRKAEDKYYILDYNGTSIFLPKNETLPTDDFKVLENVNVYISSIDKTSKDAQVVGSRTNPQFVANIIKREVEDVADGIVEIKGVSRIAGFKTKIAVTSTKDEVDPVGAIVGVKGNKIREIMDLLGGERVDVIRHNEEIVEFIASALTPAKVVGVRYTEVETDEGGTEKRAVAVVEEDQFLSALGKLGRNVKLAVMLTTTNIDVKTVAQAKEEEIEYTEVKDIFVSRRNDQIVRANYSEVLEEDAMSLEDIESMEVDIDMDTLDFKQFETGDETSAQIQTTEQEGEDLSEEFSFDEDFEDEYDF